MTQPDVCITGIGETSPTRRSSISLRQLTVEASLTAIADAGLVPSDIDGMVTDSVIMPSTVPHDWLSGQLGITRTFDAALSYGGAGTVGAPLLARMGLKQGLARNILVYFGVDWGSRPGGPYGFHDMYPAKMAFEKPVGFDGQPSYFALLAQRYAHTFGSSPEDLGTIAVTQRGNSILTGRGQKTDALSMETYLDNPMISDPLRYLDCCLITDGAVAFVMTTEERALDSPHPPVYVRGVGFGSEAITGDDVFTQRPDLLSFPGVAPAVAAAERDAGVPLISADFAEIYDCFTISCLMQLEDLGFAKKGDGGAFVRSGATALGGSLPVNTHGGLLSYSYRLGAEHVVEAVRQLRGEAGATQVANARLGVVTGLSVPDYAVLLLGN